jgi:Tat protein secretion system quality control protein TatD with DNase activity
VAIHPNEAPAYAEQGMLGEAIAVIDELAAQPRVRAIGDGAGLLPHRRAGRPAQFESFEAHIALAKKHGIAMQIHDRDARRRPRDPRAGGGARADGVPLLLRRPTWRASPPTAAIG